MNESNEIYSSFSTLNEKKFIDLILYGMVILYLCDKFDDKKNDNILISILKFIHDSQRFFKECGLLLTTKTNLKVVEFLDIDLDLTIAQCTSM